MIGVPMLPTAAVFSPAARRIDASIWVVVVLPFVPVMASHGAALRPGRASRSCQAISTSPTTSTPAAAAAANSGLSGFQPGEVTTSSVPSGSTSPARAPSSR